MDCSHKSHIQSNSYQLQGPNSLLQKGFGKSGGGKRKDSFSLQDLGALCYALNVTLRKGK